MRPKAYRPAVGSAADESNVLRSYYMNAITTMSQSSAVVATVKSVVGGFDGAAVLTKDQRTECIAQLVSGFQEGQINMSDAAKAKYSDAKLLKAYCGGLLTNWLNKSPELNGGVKYEAKNPGSKSGSPEYKAAVALKTSYEAQGLEVPAAITEFIDAELATKSVKAAPTINIEALPEALRHLILEAV